MLCRSGWPVEMGSGQSPSIAADHLIVDIGAEMLAWVTMLNPIGQANVAARIYNVGCARLKTGLTRAISTTRNVAAAFKRSAR